MRQCEGHGIDAGKVLAVEQMLLAGQAATLPAEIGAERADHRVEDRDGRHLDPAAAIDQRLAQRLIDEGIKDKAGIGLDAGDDPLDLALGAHHRPDVLYRLCALELYEAGACDRMDRVAGCIRDEMEMEAGHGITRSRLWRSATDRFHHRSAAFLPARHTARDNSRDPCRSSGKIAARTASSPFFTILRS